MKIIEVSSEAAHKVGGIYTVLKTKAGEMMRRFDDDYLLIGFYEPHSFKVEVEAMSPPENIKKVMESMEKIGVRCYYGKWTKGDDVRVVLLDPYNYVNQINGGEKQINKIKYELWKNHGIESLWSPYDFDLNVGWAWTAGMFIERYKMLEKERIIAHFHEWMSGAGILYLKGKNADVKTVFTTHATTLGRTKASMEEDFMKEVINGLKNGKTVDARDAYKYKLESKHLMEKACAQKADVFTTVSDITAKECEYILGKKPDKITPNGVDFSDFPKKSELEKRHWESKEKISNFLYSMFLPYYKIDPMNSLVFYISGRYEYRNKGIDVFIEGLAKLNERLKAENSKKEVFALLLVPTNVSGPKQWVLENVLLMDDLMDNLNKFLKENKDLFVLEKMERVKHEEEFLRGLRHKILLEIADNSIVKRDYKENEYIRNAIELFKNLKKGGELPENICYEMTYENDKILDDFELMGLRNSEEDRVKVVFYGTYVKMGDGLIDLSYYDTVLGSDVGFFPSRYEPWGYTPIEAAAQKTIALTSNLAGFGCFLQNRIGKTEDRGIKVLDVVEDGVEERLSEIMSRLVESKGEDIDKSKKDAYQLASLAVWSELIKNYLEAYEMVINGKK
jgi:glycogen(starch) synthase